MKLAQNQHKKNIHLWKKPEKMQKNFLGPLKWQSAWFCATSSSLLKMQAPSGEWHNDGIALTEDHSGSWKEPACNRVREDLVCTHPPLSVSEVPKWWSRIVPPYELSTSHKKHSIFFFAPPLFPWWLCWCILHCELLQKKAFGVSFQWMQYTPTPKSYTPPWPTTSDAQIMFPLPMLFGEDLLVFSESSTYSARMAGVTEPWGWKWVICFSKSDRHGDFFFVKPCMLEIPPLPDVLPLFLLLGGFFQIFF